ncbi:ABC transporter ATP-binding protein [Laribacter hongkongensis]|uniref:ABC transporter ATP-binding protein n=1 Tax=Laribacter hongkongensis TaxID=168471 RepID=UPI001877FAA0|nr:ABC transporter ATP-binding protein [Laribacter hongkongensis]
MLAASFSELFSIGMVIPFLGVLTTPELIYEHRFINPLVMFFGMKNPQDLLLPITLLFVIAIILSAAIRFSLVWLQTRVSLGIVTEMAVETYSRTLYQPYAVHISRNSSEIISSILTKVNGGIGATIGPLLLLLSSTLITTTILTTLIFFDPIVALTSFFGFGSIYAAIVFLTKKQLARDSLRISQASNEVVKVLQEGLGGIRDVLLDGIQSTYGSAYRNADVELRNAQASIQIISSAPRFAIEALGIAAIAVIAYWLSTKSGGIVTVIPVLGALAIGAQKLLPVLQQAYSSWALIQGGRESLRDVLDLLDQPLPEISTCSQLRSEIIYTREIRLEHIAFRYTSQSPYVLRDICLSLPKGGRIGFIGTTGSGKSTLLDILMGLLQPTEGNLVIDEVALTPLNQRAWQAHIAHVPQAIFLSDATIAENIAFGSLRDEIDLERVKTAAQQAQIADVIESWGEQYNTLVGERGVKLSGGQRQRIGIARALYKQAEVIIFDEATSALDNETEQAVMQAIDSLGSHLTILIVAHRLTTLRNCTQIIELQNGELKRVGSYAEIVEKSDRVGG